MTTSTSSSIAGCTEWLSAATGGRARGGKSAQVIARTKRNERDIEAAGMPKRSAIRPVIGTPMPPVTKPILRMTLEAIPTRPGSSR